MNSEKKIEDLLREACALGDEDGVRSMIDAGVDINSKHSINGWTGLHWAAKRGHVSIVRLLLAHGANSTSTSLYGECAYNLAANDEIRSLLYAGTTSENRPKSPLPITPNYLANPCLAPRVIKQETISSQMPTFQNNFENESKRKFEEEIVLKVRIADSEDEDFIEIEILSTEMSFENVLRTCCEELEVPLINVVKLRKLPNTIVRKDKDVLRFQNFQELELVTDRPTRTKQNVLKTNVQDNKYCDRFEKESDTNSPLVKKSNYCKNGTILY